MLGRQIQKAGDNSTQYTAENITINQGLTAEQVKDIFHEVNEISRQSYTQEAYETAIRRVNMFERILMDTVEQVDGMKEAFADPGFQFLLGEAQKKAAATERENDYGLLTELLAQRVIKGEDRKFRAGISQAVKIVDEIDDGALCGLTMLNAIGSVFPLTGECEEALDILEQTYKTLLYTELPDGGSWLEHLEVLNTIKLSNIMTIKSFEEVYEQVFDGFVCVGIGIDSPEYNRAKKIMLEASIPIQLLVKNEWVGGYVRLPVPNKHYLDSMTLLDFKTGQYRRITEEQKKALLSVYGLYTNDDVLRKVVADRLIQEVEKRSALARVRGWWNKLPCSFSITQVGRVLAYANAQKYCSSFPEMTGL